MLRSIFNALSKALPSQPTPMQATDDYKIFSFGAAPDRKYRDADALGECQSWAAIAANRNAVAIAKANMRLLFNSTEEIEEAKHFPMRTHRKAVSIESDDVVEITSHPMITLLREVNPNQDHFEFMCETSLSLDLTGNAYWWKERGPLAMPFSLWLLKPSLVSVDIGQDMTIQGYWYGKGTSRVYLPKTDVIHFRRPTISNQYLGMGRIEQAFRAICTAKEREKYECDLLMNRGVQDMLVKPTEKTVFTESQKRELQLQLGSELRSNKIKVSKGDVIIEKLASSPRELLALNSREWNVKEIVNAFGQPEALYSKDSNRANIEGAIYLWGAYELDATLALIAEKLNHDLCSEYDERLYVEFDTTAARDKEHDLRQETADLTGHVRTVNEVRISRNLPPLDDSRADDPFYVAAPAASSLFGGMTDTNMTNTDDDGEDRDVATPAPAAPDGQVKPTESVQDTALNGAQVSSLVELVTAVANGTLSRDAAIAIILVAFPTVDETEARRIVNTPINPVSADGKSLIPGANLHRTLKGVPVICEYP